MLNPKNFARVASSSVVKFILSHAIDNACHKILPAEFVFAHFRSCHAQWSPSSARVEKIITGSFQIQI